MTLEKLSGRTDMEKWLASAVNSGKYEDRDFYMNK
jgi:hypothetical protein